MFALRSVVLTVLVVGLVLGFAARSEAAPTKEQLLGVWEGPAAKPQIIWEFTKDDKLIMSEKDDVSTSSTKSPYTLSGSAIESAGEKITIKSLDDKSLVVIQGKKELKFTKKK